MIQAEDLHKRFGATVALDGLRFSANDGRITGLLGPNGAGKTTALRILYGLMRSDSGKVEVDGFDVASETLAARRRLGVLADGGGLSPRLSAREHIRYFGRLHGISQRELEARIEELVGLLDMAGIIDRRAQGFSHGERVKTALAQALVHQPQNVVLDEPTNGLDVKSVRALRRILGRLRDAGRCVLFSSHVMQEVTALCDDIVVMSAGRVVARGAPAQILEQAGRESLEEAFVALTGVEEEQ